MPRKLNKGNGLYAYLNFLGVLDTGNDEFINQAKRTYWLEYKKNWNKAKLKKCKLITIRFNHKQLKVINTEAERFNTTPTNFIREAALASKHGYINPVAIGEIRELLALHYSYLQSLGDEEKIPIDIVNQMLTKITNLENQVLGILNKSRGA